MAEAVGILEVFGLATAFVAADAGCKAANVRLEVFDKNKPANADSLPVPLLVCIKFRGKRRGRYRRCGSRNGRSKPENWCSAALRNTKSDRGYGKDAENQRPG